MKREINLGPEQVKAILLAARAFSLPAYLSISLMAKAGLRVGEVAGLHQVWKPPRNYYLKGLQVEDLRDEGIWVDGKKGNRSLQPLPKQLIQELRDYIGKRDKGPIFQYHHRTLERWCLRAAELAKIEDWKLVHSHRFRHFFITHVARIAGRDPFKVRDMARHKNVSATNTYVAQLAPEEKQELEDKFVQLFE